MRISRMPEVIPFVALEAPAAHGSLCAHYLLTVAVFVARFYNFTDAKREGTPRQSRRERGGEGQGNVPPQANKRRSLGAAVQR